MVVPGYAETRVGEANAGKDEQLTTAIRYLPPIVVDRAYTSSTGGGCQRQGGEVPLLHLVYRPAIYQKSRSDHLVVGGQAGNSI